MHQRSTGRLKTQLGSGLQDKRADKKRGGGREGGWACTGLSMPMASPHTKDLAFVPLASGVTARYKGGGFKAALRSEVAFKQVSGSGTEAAFRLCWFRGASRHNRFAPASNDFCWSEKAALKSLLINPLRSELLCLNLMKWNSRIHVPRRFKFSDPKRHLSGCGLEANSNSN